MLKQTEGIVWSTVLFRIIRHLHLVCSHGKQWINHISIPGELPGELSQQVTNICYSLKDIISQKTLSYSVETETLYLKFLMSISKPSDLHLWHVSKSKLLKVLISLGAFLLGCYIGITMWISPVNGSPHKGPELWCFYWQIQQVVAWTVELSLIWDVITLVRRHSNVCTILNQTVTKPYPYTEFDGTHIKWGEARRHCRRITARPLSQRACRRNITSLHSSILREKSRRKSAETCGLDDVFSHGSLVLPQKLNLC